MKVSGIKGMVTGILIRKNDIEYSIRYVKNGEPEIVWLYDFEIELNVQVKAGFNKEVLPKEDNSTIFLIEQTS